MTWGKNDESKDQPFEVPDKTNIEKEAVAFSILDDLLEYLNTFDGRNYSEIFQMLYENRSTKEIFDELDILWTTAANAVKKVRKMAQIFAFLTDCFDDLCNFDITTHKTEFHKYRFQEYNPD